MIGSTTKFMHVIISIKTFHQVYNLTNDHRVRHLAQICLMEDRNTKFRAVILDRSCQVRLSLNQMTNINKFIYTLNTSRYTVDIYYQSLSVIIRKINIVNYNLVRTNIGTNL